MDRLRILGGLPSTDELDEALTSVAATLDRWMAYYVEGAFHFPLGGGWTIAVSAESAGRFKIDACHRTVPRSTMWVLAQDHARLASVAKRLSEQVTESV